MPGARAVPGLPRGGSVPSGGPLECLVDVFARELKHEVRDRIKADQMWQHVRVHKWEPVGERRPRLQVGIRRGVHRCADDSRFARRLADSPRRESISLLTPRGQQLGRRYEHRDVHSIQRGER